MKSALDRLRELRSEVGTSEFDRAVKSLMRERVSVTREKRKRFPPSMYQRLYDKQTGDCPWCNERLLVPARKNAIDHKDPNRQDFNSVQNLQLLHPNCNSKKSAKSIHEQSKATGRTYEQLLGDDTI